MTDFNSDGGSAERSRDRGDGGSGGAAPGTNSSGSTGSTSSGSSSASHGGTTAAGNAALWGELSRSLQYNNYPGFGSAWQGNQAVPVCFISIVCENSLGGVWGYNCKGVQLMFSEDLLESIFFFFFHCKNVL